MRIAAFDPGGTTGWAEYVNNSRVKAQITHGVIENGLQGFLAWESDVLLNADVIVIEDFVVEPGFVGRPDASEIIGAIVAMAALLGKPVYRQLRSQKATLVRGSEAARFRWLRAHGFDGMTHELDAVTHILVRLKNMGDRAAYEKFWSN